jgi:hypothetical protein
MRDTQGNPIKIGAKVRLTNPCPSYSIGKNNPAVGTKWECEGVLVSHGTVHWDNGTQNSYKSGELALADGCISIWYDI